MYPWIIWLQFSFQRFVCDQHVVFEKSLLILNLIITNDITNDLINDIYIL